MSAQNVANMTTPGYKKRVSFASMYTPVEKSSNRDDMTITTVDLSDGKLIDTNNPTDLALSGSGFFVVRSGERLLYTRQGEFQRDGAGHLVTDKGFALQAEDGGDLTLHAEQFQVTADGVVLEAGEPVARLAVVDFKDPRQIAYADGGMFSADAAAATLAGHPAVHQQMLESSNVSNGDEMVAIMEALRRAETAQRLVTVYDDLMGRALSVFGQV